MLFILQTHGSILHPLCRVLNEEWLRLEVFAQIFQHPFPAAPGYFSPQHNCYLVVCWFFLFFFYYFSFLIFACLSVNIEGNTPEAAGDQSAGHGRHSGGTLCPAGDWRSKLWDVQRAFFFSNAGKSETAERKAKLSTREQIFSGNIKKAGFWN